MHERRTSWSGAAGTTPNGSDLIGRLASTFSLGQKSAVGCDVTHPNAVVLNTDRPRERCLPPIDLSGSARTSHQYGGWCVNTTTLSSAAESGSGHLCRIEETALRLGAAVVRIRSNMFKNMPRHSNRNVVQVEHDRTARRQTGQSRS